MNWVKREEFLKHLIIDVVRHVQIIKGVATVKADDALSSARKIFKKYYNESINTTKHETKT